MKKILVLLLLLFVLRVSAQVKENAIGVRLGLVQGISFQHLSSSKLSFEGLLAMYRYDPCVLGFIQYRFPGFLNHDAMSLMFGFGFHAAYIRGYKNFDWYPDYDDQQIRHFISGLDVQLGINYNLPDLPIGLSLDFRPAYNFIGHEGLWYGAALSLRYRF